MKKILLIIAAILLPTLAFGTTYYIDPTCATPGNGTSQTCSGANAPFNTWTSVTFAAGNTYSQKAGTTYNGVFPSGTQAMIIVNASGTAGNPITLNSYGVGAKPIISGAVTISDHVLSPWTSIGGGWYTTPVITYQPYISNLISEDGVYLQYYPKNTTDGNFYFDGTYTYYKPTSGDPTNHLLKKQYYYGIHIGANSYITVDGLDFRNIGVGVFGTTTNGTANSYITITNCAFRNHFLGVWFSLWNADSTGINISNNTFDYVQSNIELQITGDCARSAGGSTGDFKSVTIANNTITHGNLVQGASYEAQTMFSNEDAWDKEGLGWQSLMNSNVYGNSISGNIRGIVFFVCEGANGTDNNIYNNFINVTNGSTPRIGIDIEPRVVAPGAIALTGNKIYYNIIIGTPTYGIYASNITTPVASYNYIYNNTIMGGAEGIFGNATTDYYVIKNNIFYNTSNYFIYFPTANAHLVSDYNLFKGYNGWEAFYYGPQKTWAQWNALGFDTHSVAPHTDPLFTNGSGTYSLASDFTIPTGSPAKDAGVDVSLTSDYLGNKVPYGAAPDIGAFEYGIFSVLPWYH